MKDWETHLTTIFPEIRLKRYLEMRGADGGPWANICALPALWVTAVLPFEHIHHHQLHRSWWSWQDALAAATPGCTSLGE